MALPPLPPDDAALKLEIKRIIVTACERDALPESIGDDDVLIGDDSSLALDSLDSLQAAVAISKRFGVRIQDSKHARRVMRSSQARYAMYGAGFTRRRRA